MFIGHFAVGLASKRAAPQASLGWLMAAPLALDLLWPLFLIAGVERVRIVPGDTAFTPLSFDWYPWSHSLLMTLVWSVLGGGVYWAFTKYGRGAVVIGLGVLSHWLLDAVTHRPDLPLAPNSGTMVGFGLWSSVTATVLVELSMFTVAVWIYARATVARDRMGRWGFVAFVLLALVGYAGNVFGGPPPSVGVVMYGALVLYIVPVWAGWFDGHRTARMA